MKSKPSKDLNILILGETGVGKSTWINSFANFLKYRTLNEAKNNDLFSIIPSEFTVYDKNFNNVTVSTGKDINEAGQKGQSATQDARVYTFKFKDSMIRLIDTPGIGDTRGIDQDKKNFENILNTIDGFSVIHGICILLKPNESRLTIMFRFCIQELFAHLHKDAVQNIIFCFTNTRGTSYKPGDSLVILKELLETNELNIVSKSTVYCFDSEAYRFLAAVKNNPPIKFSRDEKANFKTSWKRSASETKRLIDFIRFIPPHQVKSTLTLNNMRKTIFNLTKPMAEITRLMETNKNNLEDKEFQEEIQIIQDVSIKIAYFIQSNAITPYNDKIEEYLGHLINEEIFKVQQGCDNIVLKGLEEHLNSYTIEKKSIESAISSGLKNNDVTLVEIEKVLKEAQTLKHYGKRIKEALDCVNPTAENVVQLSLSSAPIIEMTETSIIQVLLKGLTSCVF